jgi:hypothetical protein
MGNPRESGKDTFGCFQVESSSKCCLVWEMKKILEMEPVREVMGQLPLTRLPSLNNNILIRYI